MKLIYFVIQACDKLLRLILGLLIKDSTQFSSATISSSILSDPGNDEPLTLVDIILKVISVALILYDHIALMRVVVN